VSRKTLVLQLRLAKARRPVNAVASLPGGQLSAISRQPRLTAEGTENTEIIKQ
jgi:hypothetical protein